MINRSTYYDGKEFRYDGRDISFDRVWGGISFPGSFAVVIGEEQIFHESHYYILCEVQSDDLVDLVATLRQVEAEYSVERWVGNLDKNIEEFLYVTNAQASRKRLRTLLVLDAPRIKNTIDTQLELVIGLVKPIKLLHFFGQSMLPAALESAPSVNIKAEEHPRLAALANVVSGMLKYGHERVNEAHLMPEVEQDF